MFVFFVLQVLFLGFFFQYKASKTKIFYQLYVLHCVCALSFCRSFDISQLWCRNKQLQGLLFLLISLFFVLQMLARRKPRGLIHSIEIFNEMDEQGHWIACTYSLWDWVLLRPSSRGHFRVKKKDNGNVSKQWKGRIKAFKYSSPLSSRMEVLIQHVYMHKELALSHWPSVTIKSLAINPTVSVYFSAYMFVYQVLTTKKEVYFSAYYFCPQVGYMEVQLSTKKIMYNCSFKKFGRVGGQS